jgi:hypothetical protein
MARINGWDLFVSADAQYVSSMEQLANAKSDYGPPLAGFANACSYSSSGILTALEDLYERMQRLHQKIDRIEAAIGSVKKK